MIIDNLIVNGLKKEFSEKLINGRIEKIYQPDKDSFIINVWQNRKITKLFFSLNPSTYRACITDKEYPVNNQYSTFCLHLKKSLESGYIVEIKQINFDRIIEFKIESFDNVKDKVNLYLILELTGKYSNLILLNEEYNVLGCFKLIDDTQNEERQILLGKKYYPITNKSNKLELSDLSKQVLQKQIAGSELILKKFLVNKLLGISSHTAEIIIKKSALPDIKVNLLSPEQQSDLYKSLNDFSDRVINEKINLSFFKTEKGIDFALTEENPESISAVLDNDYYAKENLNRFNLLKNEITKIAQKNFDKLTERINYQEDVLLKSEQADGYKQFGDLLFSNLHALPEKAEFVTVENYYAENIPVKIALNENLTISENGQAFYKKYNKLRNSEDISIKLIEEYQKELDYIEQVIASIDNCENLEDLKEIEQELIEEKYIIKNIKKPVKKPHPEKKNLLTTLSQNGLEILVGKNNKQNDFLTTKFASENDIWLHTRLIPGSHVVIRTENGNKEIKDQDIIDAAIMAARYSKAKYSSNVCVIYTKIKYVKKPPHAKPGLVIYSKEKAVFVTP